jgi:arabinofuranan 3-O-arabinosyltransferase
VPGVPVPSSPGSGHTFGSVQRLRLFAVCLGLVVATFAQNAGSVAADTKLDLIVDPARFLRRSLSLWDPVGSAGQLQDQAYGYLFPMGPFFLLGKWLALPPWVIQRCWESLVLIIAFLGVVRLARLLGNQAFWPRVAAGLAYALAPRMLSELFSISAELLPVAVLPWVLVPLVRASADEGCSPRRATARSGVALLFAGGINASATLAILPAPALFLLTRARGPRRAALIRWWLLSVLLTCLWWLLPLLLLGRYSPPFLDWIESAAVTTTPTSLTASLRGVTQWLAYLGPAGLPAGWVLVVAPAAILATCLVAALGLAGIARAEKNRLFLIGCLLLGLVLVTLGHRGPLGPPFAGQWQRLLDGPANAFRNVHKFDPLVRLPLALGLGQLLAWGHPRLAGWRRWLPGNPVLLPALALLAIGAVAIGPIFGGRMVGQPRPVADQAWWSQAASWLAANSGGGQALLVPGAGRPNMVWGQTVDDPLQPLARSPWTVRDGLPLAQPDYIRLLDSIDAILARGQGDDTLQVLLARAGVKYLVVRNDLDSASAASTRLSDVHASIAHSAGLREVAGFGPDLGGDTGLASLTDQGAWPRSPAVQVYSVAAYAGLVGLLPAADLVTATGSADALASLVERGLGVDRPVRFEPAGAEPAGAGPAQSGTTVATDGIRRREISFGVPNQYPATLDAGSPYELSRAVHDYLPARPGPLSTMRLVGVAAVRASSSGAQVGALLNHSPTSVPYAALDRNSATAWKSGALGAVGQWLQVDFSQPISQSGVRIRFADGLGDFPTRLRVSTDAGTEDVDVANDARPQPLPVPTGQSRTLRITVLAMAGGGQSVGIADLAIPGVNVTRTLDVPMSGSPDVLAFDVAPGYRAECLPVAGGAACDPANAATGEEDTALDRSFPLGSGRTYRLAATVRLRPSSGLTAALDALDPVTARASSTQAADPRVRAGAAVDGDPATTWIAKAGDPQPTLTVRLPQPQRFTGVRLQTSADAPVSRPLRVRVQAGDQSWTGALPDSGLIDFDRPARSQDIAVTVLQSTLRYSTDEVTHAGQQLPTGISEVQPIGASQPAVARSFEIGCAAGLVVQVDGRSIPLRASVPVSVALSGQPVLAIPCGDDRVQLAAGTHRLRLAANSMLAPDSITATAEGVPPLASPTGTGLTATVRSQSSTSRRIEVHAAQAAYLVVRENANAGWRASLDGHRLRSVTLDGWQQGYLIPAGSSGVVALDFTPQRPFAAGLVVGLLAVLLLLGMCWWRSEPQRYSASPAGTLSAPVTAGLIALAGFTLLGFAGLLLAGGLLAAQLAADRMVVGRRSASRPRWPAWLHWLPPAALALVGVLAAYFPPGSAHSVSESWLGQLLSGLAVLATAAAAIGSTRLTGRPSRRIRRSTPNQETAATAVAATAVSPNSSPK